MKVMLQKIDESEFLRLSNLDETYFYRNCIFNVSNDNIVAFPIYNNLNVELTEYYKVINSK